MDDAMPDARDLDPNFAVTRVADGLRWWRGGWTVAGQGWSDAEPFTRLPDRARATVPGPVWELSRASAGLTLEFTTDSRRLAARWTVRSAEMALDHMPATGVSGLDLYVDDGARWRWAAVGRAPKHPTNEAQLLRDLPRSPRDCRLYLPLYNGVTDLEIGLDPDASLIARPARPRPIVVYGTSIVQGASASRPGMAYPAILGRMLDQPLINLGFSGNARMEPALAALLGELDASAYVLDCLPNLSDVDAAERAGPFVRALRAARPQPIVLVENIIYQGGWIDGSGPAWSRKKNAVLRGVFAALVAAGLRGLHYVAADDLLGDDGDATVDGTHPTDVGFQRMAAAIAPAVRLAIGG
jgi:hypothetical protein